MRKLIFTGVLFSLLALISLSVIPTTQAMPQVQQEYQYSAKFICGRTDALFVAPGQYFTIVNVHNPSPTTSIKLRKKFATTEREEQPGSISKFFGTALKPDQALRIDCPNIYNHLQIPPGTFIEGFAVIQSLSELDVVALYTAGGNNVEALHTERVPPRRIPYVP
jgi:hypothetical protein